METKQTAVWFLIKELSDKIAFTPSSELAVWHAQLYVRALQIEREQIIDAYYYDPNCDEIKDDGEQYYNETYGEKFWEKFGGQDE